MQTDADTHIRAHTSYTDARIMMMMMMMMMYLDRRWRWAACSRRRRRRRPRRAARSRAAVGSGTAGHVTCGTRRATHRCPAWPAPSSHSRPGPSCPASVGHTQRSPSAVHIASTVRRQRSLSLDFSMFLTRLLVVVVVTFFGKTLTMAEQHSATEHPTRNTV